MFIYVASPVKYWQKTIAFVRRKVTASVSPTDHRAIIH